VQLWTYFGPFVFFLGQAREVRGSFKSPRESEDHLPTSGLEYWMGLVCAGSQKLVCGVAGEDIARK
jgi:hypothetical protein